MPRIPILDVASSGLIADLPPQLLPPGAWSDAENVRFVDGQVKKANGLDVVAMPSIAPYGLFYVIGSSGPLWVYAGLTDVRCFSSTTDTEITRISGDYTGSALDQWNGGVFNGLLVINNGVDIPQLWSPPATDTKLVDLTNWTSTWRAKVLRPFKNFLVALDITKSGTRYNRMVKWSHSADSGVPSTWDETDATKDAGENNLPEGQDDVIDCLPLGRDINMVYTKTEAWIMTLSGTSSIFNFFRALPTIGLLGQGCAAEFHGRHFIVSQDDIGLHDASSFQSLADSRIRNRFFDNLSKEYYSLTKVVPDRRNREIWIFYPNRNSTDGRIEHALVWNWVNNTWHFRDVTDAVSTYGFRAFLSTVPVVTTLDTWASISSAWNTVTRLWDTLIGRSEQSIMLAQPITSNKIFLLGDLPLINGGVYTSKVTKSDITLVVRGGQVVADPTVRKLLIAAWPHVTGTYGKKLYFRAAARDNVQAPYVYGTFQEYIIGVDEKVSFDGGGIDGRFLQLEISDQNIGTNTWSLQGLELEIEELGGR